MYSGFANSTSASLKINIVDGGDKATTGEGVWGEIKITTDGLSIENNGNTNGTASVDTAKIHFGPVYLGIKSGDTQVGSYKLTSALKSGDSANALMNAAVGPYVYDSGIDLGYGNDFFSVVVI